MSKWDYFTDEETEGLADDLMYKVVRFREIIKQPVWLTETVAKGGSHVKNSAHEKGLAVDFTIRKKGDYRAYTALEQLRLAWALGRAGFVRIGVYNRHCHADVDKSKTPDAVWTGISR